MPLRKGWINDAACKNGKIDFFPTVKRKTGQMELEETYRRANTKPRIKIQREIGAEALAVCANCPVLNECRHDHLHEQYGIWWGTVPAERNIQYHANCSCEACSTRRISRRARPNDNLVCTETPEDKSYQSNTG